MNDHAIDSIVSQEISTVKLQRQALRAKRETAVRKEEAAAVRRHEREVRFVRDVETALYKVNNTFGALIARSTVLPPRIKESIFRSSRFCRRINDCYVELWGRVRDQVAEVIAVYDSPGYLTSVKGLRVEIFRFRIDQHYNSSVRVFSEGYRNLSKETLGALRGFADERALIKALVRGTAEVLEEE